MIRASAKNYLRVASVVDPGDYRELLQDLRNNQGATSLAMRYRLARKAFRHTAAYDRAIADFFIQNSAEDARRCYNLAQLG
jgi:phosphoribosylaminoimidazolecarboxamide formyltransferase/IMP cyclohydrolase